MQLDMSAIKRIAQKELTIFFASPLAYIFLTAFVGLCLFVVFWGEAFFARNIADVRPLFEWMPIMLIFLCGALTMRMWSEEKRSGTLEFLITVPTSTWQFVIGKFLACLALLTIALSLTLILPLSISFIANLDWGPIISAYLATILLGAAYLSIGLFISSRSDNQIVSLLITTIVCGLFFFIGSDLLVGLFNFVVSDYLRLLGSGSRFESITRGVLDARDLYFYLSITASFLFLNIYSLEKARWSQKVKSSQSQQYHSHWKVFTGIAVVNLLVVNFWLQQMNHLRLDMTRGNIYSISEASESYLAQLQEPLLIRGYFSDKTHPLLAPLVPQLRDLLKEYEVSGEGKIRTEFIDPIKHPELEEEASSKFGISPVPLQIADRHQASVVNSYFDIVVQYGDEFEKLGFRELIEIKDQVNNELEVRLRNPEYDITRSIKKVLYTYQSGGNLFDSLNQPISLTAYVSNNERLPDALVEFRKPMTDVLNEVKDVSGENFSFDFVEPEANNGAVAKQIAEDFGFAPMAANLFSSDRFYFYMVLNDGKQAVQVPLPEQLSNSQFEQMLTAGIKRYATGFMKTIGLFAESDHYGGKSYENLRAAWSENYKVESLMLDNGIVPGHIDILAVIAPESLTEKQVFAIDQYMMQGGTVILATSPYEIQMSNTSLSARNTDTGLKDWLAHHGITVEESFVMDKQNAAFPVPVPRQVGPITVQEMKMLDYPFFIDIRERGFSKDNMMTSGMNQLTLPWASPLTVDEEKNQSRIVTELFSSSSESWRYSGTDLLPRTNGGFSAGDEFKSELLGAAISGQFSSYFADKESPLLSAQSEENEATDTEGADAAEEESTLVSGVIKKSAESARLILVPSSSFINDQTMRLAGMAGGTEYLNPLQFMTNAVEWSLEDTGLLTIRGRGQFSQTLPPIENGEQWMIELGNYLAALFLVFAVFWVRRFLEHKKHVRYSNILAEGA